MSSKPRKNFDGVGRPQGFIDDAAKAALKGIKKAIGTATLAQPRAVKDLQKRGISKVDAKDFIYGNKYREYGAGFSGKKGRRNR